MKIRIKGNSVRYRLTKTDIDTLETKGIVREETHFPLSVFSYVLRADKHAEHIEAFFADNTITISMPQAMTDEWVRTEQVGFDARLPLPNGDTLYLLLEKDFKCLDDTIEDQSDNYDNPLAARS